jgi:stress response protein YsnF
MSRNARELVLPRVEERAFVEMKETARERVRITKTVDEDEVEVAGEAVEEDVEVERVPIGRVVAEPPQPRVEGDVTIIPVVEEIVVVEKRLLLREEVHVTKRRRAVRKKLRVPVRKERISVERTKPATGEDRRRER